MKKKILIGLLALLIAELSFVGYVEARYASSHDVTTQLVVDIVANQYDLTLDANGGAFADASDGKLSVDYNAPYGTLPTPSRDGYEFDGWYTEETGGTKIESTDTVKITEDTTIYAHWTANSYTIAYDRNSGSGTMGTTAATYDKDVALAENAFTKTGYTFTGWNTEPAGTGTPYADKATVKNLTAVNGGTVTLYAQWEANKYAVKFNGNGGAGGMENQTFTYDVAENLNKNLFSRTGYTFTGWNTKADGKGGTAYADEASILNLTPGGIVELYAQWEANEYFVSFDTQTDDVADPVKRAVTFGQRYGTLPTLVRTGYDFSGWTTAPAGNIYITPGSIVTTAANHTLYAQWGAKTYTIRYHANGGTGTMDDQLIAYDNMFSLRANTFAKENYNFLGWATTADATEIEFADQQSAVNLLESGTLDLYAVWAEKTYTLTFDYNGGDGSSHSQQIVYNKEYGVLPTYPTKEKHVFSGWYTEPVGGTRVFPSTIVTVQEDHTLYAHWDPSPSNEVIEGLVVKNNPDDNKDGVVDAVYLTFVCSSYFEKFNIPLKGLTPGQRYRLTYTASNNASFGDNIKGYGGARYGSYIVEEPEYRESNIDDALGQDIIATWANRVEADGVNDGNSPATNDAWLNGPHANRMIEFVATAENMYWCWEFGLMQDGYQNEYNITNTLLVPIPPSIEFANKIVLKGAGSNAQITAQTNSSYATTFTFDGESGCETIYYPISGLTAGSTYTITFDHEYEGNLIKNTDYDYGCAIMNAVPTNYPGKFTGYTTALASNTFIRTAVDGLVQSATLTFKATGSTAYWVWNMANCSDATNGTTKVTVTNFSATHSTGASITYYSAESKAGQQDTLDLMPEAPHAIALDYYGIDDTYMDIWYPVDEQYPAAGDSYEIAFEPSEGCTMAETITVSIDGTAYTVRTDGQAEEGAPYYDPEQNMLTIPAQLLTKQTQTVAIVASAVKIQTEESTDPPATEPPVSSVQKTLLEKLLAAQTLQEMNDLLASNETGAQALGASEVSLVRQRADTIYAEAALTEEVRSAYETVSNRLNALVSRLVNDEESTEPDPTESPEPPAATDPVETTPPVVQTTALDKMLAATSLQELSSLLAGDEASTLSAAELSQVRMYADTLYAEATLTEEVTTCYGQISDRLNQLVSQL